MTRNDGIEDNSLESTIAQRNNTDNNENDDDEDQDNQDNIFNLDNLTRSNNNHKKGYDGYCFIGTNSNNVRTCARVYKNNKCMSGEIFPSLQICMNPELRE